MKAVSRGESNERSPKDETPGSRHLRQAGGGQGRGRQGGGGRRGGASFCLAAGLALALLTGLPGTWPGAGAAGATEMPHLQTNTREALLARTPPGISADPLGRIELADRAERLTSLGEPYVFAASSHPDGWVVGTGSAGKVLVVGRDGSVREVFTAPESSVFAVRADDDGTVYAGTSPRGKVYRIRPDGESEVFFDPDELYIWALEWAADGALLVATGTDGKLFRVAADGEGELLYDGDDTHLRSLVPLPDGDLLLGTAEEGLILRLAADGSSVRALYDAKQPEVVALAAGPDGASYAAVVASEASLGDRTAAAQAGGNDDGGEDDSADSDEPRAVVTVTETSEPSPSLRRRGKAQPTPRGELLRIDPDGRVESVWAFPDETPYSLLWSRGRLWVGTGLEGKLYSWDGEQLVLEKDVDERQIVALTEDDPGPSFTTTNAAAVYRMTGGTEREGVYTSPALDAEEVSRFGTLHWRGDLPGGSELSFAFRSGFSSEPDRTWSPWVEVEAEPSPGGGEVSLDGVPPGRYVQWRAELRSGGGASPRLSGVELSYRQSNLRPVIKSLQVLDPGQVIVPAGFNPSSQVFEPASPNRDGIFTTLEAASDDVGGGRTKTLWKKGYRSLRWEAEDPNEDSLVYRVEFRPEAGSLDAEDGWMPVGEELNDDYLSFDATVLPDGIYRFRLVASDAPDNAGELLESSRTTEPVVIDHTVPDVGEIRFSDHRLSVEVRDGGSPLREAMVSRDAGEWEPARAADGLVDGRTETVWVDGADGARLLLLRLTDAAFNTVTVDLTPHVPAAVKKRSGRRGGER